MSAPQIWLTPSKGLLGSARHSMTGEWLTLEQRRVLAIASAVPATDGTRPFQSAAQLGVSPVVCGRLVTMLFLEGYRPDVKAEDGSRTFYRITPLGLAALAGA